MSKITVLFKVIFLSIFASLLISFVEVCINEETFYNHASVHLVAVTPYGSFTELKSNVSRDLICPTNFEVKIFKILTRDNKVINLDFNVLDRIKDTKYQKFPEEFIGVDNEKKFQEKIHYIDENIKNCEILIRADAKYRMILLTVYSALQPLHLFLGWLLAVILIKTGKTVYLVLHKYIFYPILTWLKRVGYFFRGIFRRISKIFKDYEDIGK